MKIHIVQMQKINFNCGYCKNGLDLCQKERSTCAKFSKTQIKRVLNVQNANIKQTVNIYNLKDHILDEHKYPCGDTVIIFINVDKIKNRIGKLQVKNSSFNNLYSKSWFDANWCNPSYCSERNQMIACLNSDECWINVKRY